MGMFFPSLLRDPMAAGRHCTTLLEERGGSFADSPWVREYSTTK